MYFLFLWKSLENIASGVQINNHIARPTHFNYKKFSQKILSKQLLFHVAMFSFASSKLT